MPEQFARALERRRRGGGPGHGRRGDAAHRAARPALRRPAGRCPDPRRRPGRVILVWDPPRRIGFGIPGGGRVHDITITATAGGSRVRLLDEGVPDAEADSTAACRAGFLGKLRVLAETGRQTGRAAAARGCGLIRGGPPGSAPRRQPSTPLTSWRTAPDRPEDQHADAGADGPPRRSGTRRRNAAARQTGQICARHGGPVRCHSAAHSGYARGLSRTGGNEPVLRGWTGSRERSAVTPEPSRPRC